MTGRDVFKSRKQQRWRGRLSPEESLRSSETVTDLNEAEFYRVVSMALYATSLRRAELAHLKVTDIDSERMVIHVKGGKGRKDRDVMLSPKLLEELRSYVRGLRRKPEVWLFPGNRWHTGENPITTKVIWATCRQTATRAGLGDEIHPRTLRYCLPLTCLSQVPICERGRVHQKVCLG